jgi:hypothetical protein
LRNIFLFFVLLSSFPLQQVKADVVIAPDNKLIQYSGRIDFSDPKAPRFDWPGTSIKAGFRGGSIGYLLQDGGNNYDLWIDGQAVTTWVTHHDQTLYLWKDNRPGDHVARLVKRTEADFGMVVFKGLVLPGRDSLRPLPPPPVRKIEFLGDSWVCGYGDEGPGDDCRSLRLYENADRAFGPLIARDLDADAHLIACTGRGVVRNNADNKSYSHEPFFPIFSRTLLHDSKNRWDPSTWVPDAVVLHLGLNDFSKGPKPSARDFVRGYLGLLKGIRRAYPRAVILCSATLGPPHFGQLVQEAVKTRNGSGDPSVYFVGFPELQANEHGCNAHPNTAAHRKFAGLLIKVLKEKLGW